MAAEKNKPQIFTRNFILITFINLFVFLSFQMIFPTLPLLIRNLGGSDSIIGLVIGAFTVTSLLTRPFAGLALDVIGRRPVFTFGLLILMLTCLSYSIAGSIEVIVLIRLLHGFGWGISGTSASTIAAEVIPKARFGEGMGYFSMANSISLAIAPAAGLYLMHHYGFKIMFMTSTALVAVSFILAWFLRLPPYHYHPHPGRREALYEKTAFGPALMIFFLSLTFGGVASFLPLYAYSRGVEPIGFFFTIYAAAIFISRPLSGRIIDRKSYDYTVIPGLLLVAAAMIIIAYSSKAWEFGTAAFVYGIGFGYCQMSFQTMVARNVERSRLGASNATFFSGLDLGMGLGALVLGTVAELLGYSRMYLIAGALILLAFMIYVCYLRRIIPGAMTIPKELNVV